MVVFYCCLADILSHSTYFNCICLATPFCKLDHSSYALPEMGLYPIFHEICSYNDLLIQYWCLLQYWYYDTMLIFLPYCMMIQHFTDTHTRKIPWVLPYLQINKWVMESCRIMLQQDCHTREAARVVGMLSATHRQSCLLISTFATFNSSWFSHSDGWLHSTHWWHIGHMCETRPGVVDQASQLL